MGKISANLGTTLLLDKPVNIFVVEPKNVANISVIPQYAGAEANFSVGAGAGAGAGACLAQADTRTVITINIARTRTDFFKVIYPLLLIYLHLFFLYIFYRFIST